MNNFPRLNQLLVDEYFLGDERKLFPALTVDEQVELTTSVAQPS